MKWLASVLMMGAALWSAQAQSSGLALFRVDARGDANPVGGVLETGIAAPGDVLDTTLRLRNLSSASITVSVLRIAGTGFSVERGPAMPVSLVPGGNADFVVRFRPHAPGLYSATLTVQGLSVLVRGIGASALGVFDEKGALVDPATPIDFGAVGLKQAVSRKLTL